MSNTGKKTRPTIKNTHTRNLIHKKTPRMVLPPSSSIGGTSYVKNFKFINGPEVPIYEVTNMHAFNQIIGYAKFLNKGFGDVYYRGECKLHDTLLPALLRSGLHPDSRSEKLNTVIRKYISDPKFAKVLGLDTRDTYSAENIVEGMLQHYGVPTRFVDVVDNHWIALWMGLNKCQRIKQMATYYHYQQRTIPYVKLIQKEDISDNDMFQYIVLIAVPGDSKRKNNGLFTSDNFVEIDLRQALPSVFLRPHAQHGLVIKRCPKDVCLSKEYDIADSVIGILKIRIDNALSWIGTGTLLSQENLFPPPAYDNGYDILLHRNDILESSGFQIAHYV